jgi:hypothetical protein
MMMEIDPNITTTTAKNTLVDLTVVAAGNSIVATVVLVTFMVPIDGREKSRPIIIHP